MGFPFGNGLPPIEPDPGLFAVLQAEIAAAFAWLLNALISIANFIWRTLVAVTGLEFFGFTSIGQFFKTIWEQYIKASVLWIIKELKSLKDWLKRVLGPIIKKLEDIKKWIDEHILKQQLRLWNMIQKIRRVLAILRIFHFKWAAALDNALADVQQRIQQSIALVRGTLNQIITTLALLLDPTLLITRNVMGGTLLSNLGALKRIFGYGDNRILSASEQATIDRDHSRYFKSSVKTHLDTLRTSGLTDDDKALRAACRQALADVTNAPVPF